MYPQTSHFYQVQAPGYSTSCRPLIFPRCRHQDILSHADLSFFHGADTRIFYVMQTSHFSQVQSTKILVGI